MTHVSYAVLEKKNFYFDIPSFFDHVSTLLWILTYHNMQKYYKNIS